MSNDKRETRGNHLKKLLEKMKPYDTTEQEYQRRMLDLLSGGKDPFSRHHFTPGHFTASSFVLSPDNRSILLIYHGKLHRWLQPGGHIDPDDANVEAAARREVLEETGVTNLVLRQQGIFDIDIHEIPPLRDDPGHEHFDIRFLFQATSTIIEASSDAKDARWTLIKEVNEVESDQSVMRAIGKLGNSG